MNPIRSLISAILFLVFALPAAAQQLQKSDNIPASEFCTDYHRKNLSFPKKDVNFRYNSQSRSALFRPGQTSKLSFTAFKGNEYRMTCGAENTLLNGGAIAFKVMDAKSKKVIFDSSEEGATAFEFLCDNSLNLILEIELPEAANAKESAKKVTYGCVGFLLESRPALQTGF